MGPGALSGAASTSANALADAVGTLHQPAGPNARIVSLVPSLTELVVDLGLGESLVGRTGFCVHPRAFLRGVPKVGGTKDLKLERILELQPTHVLVNIDENRKQDAETLIAHGLKLVVTHPQTPADNLALYSLIGGIFGAERAASALSADLREALDAAHTPTDGGCDVLYLIWREPWMSISPPTYIAQMLALGGLRAIEHGDSARYPVVADAAWGDAQAILLSSEPFAFRERHAREIHDRFGVPRDRIHFVDGELLSWYGSRAVEGVRYASGLRERLGLNSIG